MSNFKDRLWRDLVREHGAELHESNEPAAPRIWMRPRLLLGSSAAGVAGVATAIAIALGTAGTSPAFAVTQNHDGSYTVELWKVSGVTGLNERLQQLGIPARAVALHGVCYEQAVAGVQHAMAGAGKVSWTVSQARITPAQIPAGRLLEMQTLQYRGRVQILASRAQSSFQRAGTVCDAPVPPCGQVTVHPGPPPTVWTGTSTTGGSTTGTSTTATGTGTSTTGTATAGSTATGSATTGTSTTTTGTGTSTTGTATGQAAPTETLSRARQAVNPGVLVHAAGCPARTVIYGRPPGYSTGTSTTGTGTATTGATTTTGTATGPQGQAVQK